MGILRYVSHGDGVKDPAIPVPNWSLNESGAADAAALVDEGWASTVARVISSGETKAIEMASPFCAAHGIELEIRPETGEIDRSATGFVPHERHEELADRLFAAPEESADGWERAVDARDRLLTSLGDVLAPGGPDVVVVGHGGVGTILWCTLTERPIARAEDQTGPGNVWAFDLDTRQGVHPWRRVGA